MKSVIKFVWVLCALAAFAGFAPKPANAQAAPTVTTSPVCPLGTKPDYFGCITDNGPVAWSVNGSKAVNTTGGNIDIPMGIVGLEFKSDQAKSCSVAAIGAVVDIGPDVEVTNLGRGRYSVTTSYVAILDYGFVGLTTNRDYCLPNWQTMVTIKCGIDVVNLRLQFFDPVPRCNGEVR